MFAPAFLRQERPFQPTYFADSQTFCGVMLSQPFPNTLLIDLLVVQEEWKFAITLVFSPLAEQVIRNVMTSLRT